jgi:hypothetical protein
MRAIILSAALATALPATGCGPSAPSAADGTKRLPPGRFPKAYGTTKRLQGPLQPVVRPQVGYNGWGN